MKPKLLLNNLSIRINAEKDPKILDLSSLNKKSVPCLNSMRSVTPDSLQRLKELSSRGITERKFTPSKKFQDFRPAAHPVRSSHPQKQRRSFMKVVFTQRVSKSEEKKNKVSYKDFKKLHRNFNEIQKKFVLKKFNIKSRIEQIKKIVIEPHAPEPAQPEDCFLVNTVYERPAMTFAEKLYRLQQVSIFK
jgi:hypothetical protein